MSAFTVEATSIHPDHREWAMTAEFRVDTAAFYSLVPADIVERLGLGAEDDGRGRPTLAPPRGAGRGSEES